MRNLTALLFLLSLCSLHLVFSAPHAVNTPKCCDKTSKAKIPLRNIVTYWWTNTSCPVKAIIFKTIKNEICVDPTASWVNGHMKVVDGGKNVSSTAKPSVSTLDVNSTVQSLSVVELEPVTFFSQG